MWKIFLEKQFSPFDILVKNFFNTEEQFQTPTNRIINHPLDVYEDPDGLYFDIACTGLTKKQIDIKVEDDVLRVSYTKKDDKNDDGTPLYQTMDSSKLVPLLTKSLQEALARIDTLEAEVTKLKG